MKYVIVIPDGAADRPTDALTGRTPFEVARTPHMDRIAAGGRLGTVQTVPSGLAPGSDVAILSLLGYDPTKVYTGRAPLEAAARGIDPRPDDWVFRCNLVTVADEHMVDYSAGHIKTPEAHVLIRALEDRFGTDMLRFYPGVGYRHLVVIRGEKFKVRTTPPHDILGQPIKRHLPKGKNSARLRELMDASREVFADHAINQVRRDLGENPASQIWLWGEGQRPALTRFRDQWDVATGAAITAVDLVRGIATLIGWEVIEVEGATGYYDTNYAGKGKAAIAAIAGHNLVLVHVEAPDEAGHNGDAREKVRAIEAVDREIVGPLLAALEACGEPWRLLVAPDHETPLDLRTHERRPVPFAMMGSGLVPGRSDAVMTEAAARKTGMHVAHGHELMEYFLKR
ncbi:MAG: cofactor-independent phosphoglycerate mutase [Planctomycetes bacterium]|nr:cofactor-independent phosphoglycerate mutase [Planctomycetota bacterium]